MKNLTLRIDDHVLATARRYAVESGSSVNALVREFLAGIAAREERARTARARIRELSDRSTVRRGERSWTRAELYEDRG